ncbi:MAG: immunoglobulin domain-containing protein [Pontiellaceae bacterium]|nr:immunoglobulin domain-containing protein [Pontiellaceae bacterium]
MKKQQPETFFAGKGILVFCIAVMGMADVKADVTYSLTFDPASSAEAKTVADSVAEAVAIVNTYGSFNKHWTVYYNPGVPTAEANYTGYMAFGGTRNTRVVFHEGAHTLGMGTTTSYASLISSGVWAGQYGNQAQFDTYNNYADGLHGDGHAIWPGGFNYDSEDGYIERIWMLRIMSGIRCDMGIMAFSKEAENELVHPGETAVFRVGSPVATSYRWYRNGVALSNGGDISGATSATLRIANAEAADEGSYYCAATGAGETLNSRPRQLFVEPEQQLIQLDLDGNLFDSVNDNNAYSVGSPAYVTGKIGQAFDLDGTSDYIVLPETAVRSRDITVATWVNWDGGGNWQRIFDFGTGTYQYMCLTPKSGGGTLRLIFKDAINSVNAESQINTTALAIGSWVHLATVLQNGYATLYVNGAAVGSVEVPFIDPVDFLPTQNYIGKSQYADPLFNGRVDDFRIYNHALSGAEVWDLWGQSANHAPAFTTNELSLADAVASESYTGQSLSDYADDADLDTLTFSKVFGPGWLKVASNGSLSGPPASGDVGDNTFLVRVVDSTGAGSDVELHVAVSLPPIDYEAGPLAYWDFNDVDLGAANGAAVPDSDGSTVWRVAATDKSDYGNDLTTWDSAWAGFTWSTNSDQGDFSIKSAGTYPAAFTWSDQSLPSTADIESFTGTVFTVEALATVSGSGHRTVLGRDACYLSTSDSNLGALYLGLDDGNHAKFNYTDVDGNTIALTSASTYPANDTTFYHIVGVTDGSTVSLYVDGNLEAQATGQHLGGLGIGSVSGGDWHAGGWSVGRGLYEGKHTDRWFGYIDAVSISGVALTPDYFVLSDIALPAAPTGLVAESGDASVSLNWNAVSDATGYSIKVWSVSGGPYVAVSNPETNAYIHSGLPNGTNFFYVVSAINAAGEGPDSEEVHAVPSVEISENEFVVADYVFESQTNLSLTVSNSVVGHRYQILSTDRLVEPDWQSVDAGFSGTGSELIFGIPVSESDTNRYFKLDVQRR